MDHILSEAGPELILQATDIGEHLYRSLEFKLYGTLKYFFFPDVSVQAFLQNNRQCA